jgi:L-ascorbate metabolism protein UlaG (beta-lactamase superfamily)
MAILSRQIASFLRFALQPRARRESDEAVARELSWRQSGPSLPPGLTVQWLGTSGFRFAYQDHAVLVDPYVTRVPAANVLLRRPSPPSARSIDRFLPDRADAILLGHTHFDHAIDAPAIARRDGATVYGSRSLTRLMDLYGLADQAVEVEPYRTYEIGPFAVSFVPSVHSKLILGRSVPAAGDICCAHFDELAPSRYNCGDVYGIHIAVAGVSFYHQGSADLIDDAIVHRGVDYFLAGIAGRGYTERYVARILDRLQPDVIVPHHYDDFFQPLDAAMKFSFNVNLAGFADEVDAVGRDFTTVCLAPMQTVGSAEP